jgi:transposase
MKRKWRNSTHRFCQHFKKKKKFEDKGLKVIVLVQDESHVRVGYPNIRVVCPKDEKPRIKANWDKNLKTSIHGCIDNEGKWTITQEDTANRESFCRHMDKIVENYPDYQVFMILIDNATYHRGDIVREHIYKLRGQGKNIKLIRFPRYCSDLNPIEEEWRPFKRGLHNQIILIKEELTSAVVDGIAAISAASKGLLSKYFPILFG